MANPNFWPKLGGMGFFVFQTVLNNNFNEPKMKFNSLKKWRFFFK